MALYYYRNKHSDECREMVTRRVKPSLQEISQLDGAYKALLTAYCSPVLYLAHKGTALDIINGLDLPVRDHAYWAICDFLFTKIIPSDPYDPGPSVGFRLTYEEARDICEICTNVDSDWIVYSVVRRLAESMSRARAFTVEQKTDLVQRLEEIVAQKLPDARNIQHNGYAVICRAHLEHIKTTKEQRWQPFLDDALSVPNLADRVFILGVIASLIPSHYHQFRAKALSTAIQQVEAIPSLYDRVVHYEWLASMLNPGDRQTRKDLLEKAVKASLDRDEPRFTSLRRRLIDMAYRFDPELAASLASASDLDPAREEARRVLRGAYETLRLRQDMADESKTDLKGESTAFAEAAWRNLAFLNAGRLAPLSRDRIREMVGRSSGFSFLDAYPVLSWACQSLIVSCSRNAQLAPTMRLLFEALTLGTELTLRMSQRSSDYVAKSIASVTSDPNASGALTLGPDDHEKAESFIRNWMRQNSHKYIKICDPYFGPDDLWVIRAIAEEVPEIRFEVLTSRRHQGQGIMDSSWRDGYTKAWREITEQSPPDLDIIVAGVGTTGESPIHDRWLVSDGGGLRFGTSFNSLARSKYSEVSVMSRSEALEKERIIDSYLTRSIRSSAGGRVSYEQFTLS